MEYHFYNAFHYGDNILNLKFLRNLPLKENNIIIHYYYNSDYIKNKNELEQFIIPEIQLHDSNLPGDAIHLWMGKDPILEGFHYTVFDEYYKQFYKNILIKLSLPVFNTSLYHDDPLLLSTYAMQSQEYQELDILVINAQPFSGQCTFVKSEWDELCTFLHSKFKIATTHYVNDAIPCTMSDSLSLHDIAAISTHAKYIIAVHTGPIAACYNSHTKASVKKWFIFNDRNNHADLNAVDHCTMYTVSMFFILLDSTRNPS
jgi:hypothetical protein